MEKKLLGIIQDWVAKNKKTFWKYEISYYFKPYRLRVINLYDPSDEDIIVYPKIRLLNDKQKIQLCNTIKKACAKEKAESISSIEVNVNYVDDAVAVDLIRQTNGAIKKCS